MPSLRKYVQNEEEFMRSENTKEELRFWLNRSREQSGGLPLVEIAEVINETLSRDEFLALKREIERGQCMNCNEQGCDCTEEDIRNEARRLAKDNA